MAHDKAYLICENKCLVEGMPEHDILKLMNGDYTLDWSNRWVDWTQSEVVFGYSQYGLNFTECCYNNTYIKTIRNDLDLRNATKTDRMFAGCTKLQFVPDLNIPYLSSAIAMFMNCTALTEIPDLNFQRIGTSNSNMFAGCTNLTHLRDSPFAPAGSRWQQNRPNSLFADCPLNRTSILKVFEGLEPTTYNYTITISATTNGYLSDIDKAIATNKGWTISVKS